MLTIAKYEELIALAGGNLAQKRKQVVWHTLRVLAHDASRVSTARVKVSEESSVPLLKWLSSLLQVGSLSIDMIGNDILDNGLGATVGVGRTDGAVLRDRDHVLEAGGVAIDSSGGGEDDVGDVVLGHGSEERDATAHVHAVVFQGNLSRLANSLVDVSPA